MKYIDSWLSGLGLDYIIPKLEANDITTPKKLAMLSLRDIYDVVGVEDAEDRKKLYFLIQRLQTILTNKGEEVSAADAATVDDATSKGNATASTTDGNNTSKAVLLPNKKISSPKTKTAMSPQKLKGSSTVAAAAAAVAISNDDKIALPSALSNSKLPSSVSTHNRKSREDLRKSDDSCDSMALSIGTNESEDDLRNLRRRRRSTIDSVLLAKAPPSINTNAINSKLSNDFSKISMQPKKSNEVSTDQINKGSKAYATIVPTNISDDAIIMKINRSQSPIQTSYNNSKQGNGSKHSVPMASKPALERYKISISPPASPPPPGPPPTTASYELIRSKTSINNNSNTIANSSYNNNNNNNNNNSNNNNTNSNYVRPFIEDMAIRVVVRKRPLSKIEQSNGDKDVMEIRSNGMILVHEPKVKVDLTKIIETQEFIFDDSFESNETNQVIYNRTIRHLVSFVFDNGKASCFAYGQTGSGKTFTMMGSSPENPQLDQSANAGLYVLAARDIFSQIETKKYSHLQVYISCFEIYGGKLFDLLNDRSIVKCLEDAKQQVQLPGLTEHHVTSVAELLDLMARAHTNRSTGSTGANAESSRSHQVMQIVIKDPESVTNKRSSISASQGSSRKLSFIDLAGSERGADSANSSKQTRMEGAEINTSLLALKEVIRSLERKHGHTPFRGSKLTQVLKDSFVGERTRTCMIACVSPSSGNCEHTLNTLRYADRVKEHQLSQQQDAQHANNTDASIAGQQQQQLQRPSTATTNSKSSSNASLTQQQQLKPKKESRASMLPGSSTPPRPSLRRQTIASDKASSIAPSSSSVSTKVETQQQHQYVDDSDRVSINTNDTASSINSLDKLGNTELIKYTVDLLSAHRSSITEMVETIKEEMELVQCMENANDRDAETYIDRLEQILAIKGGAVASLKSELDKFLDYRRKSLS